MLRYQITHAETGETTVHYDGAVSDYTLCGDAIEVDTMAALVQPEPTTKRVDCEMCLMIVRHVRGR